MPQKYRLIPFFNTLVADFLSLIFPPTCIGCNRTLATSKQPICGICELELPSTNYHAIVNNPIERLFWGKIAIEFSCAIFFFEKKSPLQKIIHQFKYNNHPKTAIYMGKLIGEKIKNTSWLTSIDSIIPVPLHAIKQNKRGYNQAQKIAMGISQKCGIPILNDVLIKSINNTSQTNKGVFDRHQNTSKTFITTSKIPTNHHFLLVDDVITSGATLFSCAQALKKIKNTRVSILTLAVARG